ncbi:MAG: hypothetical protein JW795_21955 [Chitinivibrionales bacterium]|nr:hypothetical protein [Chitinivibrionales bacterium]
MKKTVALRLDDSLYTVFKKAALKENRSLANFIETATLSYIEEYQQAKTVIETKKSRSLTSREKNEDRSEKEPLKKKKGRKPKNAR